MVMLASQAKAKAKKGKAKASEPDRRRAVPKGGTCVTCKAEPMLADGVRCLGCEIALCHRMSGGPGEAAVQVAPVPPAPPPPAVSGVPSLQPRHVMELRLVGGLSIMLATFSEESFCERFARDMDTPGPFADQHGRYPSWVPDAAGRTYGDFLRHLAELSDRLDCACGSEPVDKGGDGGLEDEFGNPMPAVEMYPHKRAEAGATCCPHCASERTKITATDDDGTTFAMWSCEECGNDPGVGAFVMRVRQAERTPPGSNYYADALAVIEGAPAELPLNRR